RIPPEHPARAYTQAPHAVPDEFLTAIPADSKMPSGSFTVRIPPQRHADAAVAAHEHPPQDVAQRDDEQHEQEPQDHNDDVHGRLRSSRSDRLTSRPKPGSSPRTFGRVL